MDQVYKIRLKRCPICEIDKPVTEYQKPSSGLYSYCPPCRREYDLKYKWKNIDQIRYWQRVRRKRDWGNPVKQAKLKKQARKWKLLNPERVKRSNRNGHVRWLAKRKAKRIELTEGMPGNCQACGVQVSKDKMVWDHNHSTGAFRGWLCVHCNVTLGMAKESTQRLQRLIEYLNRR